MYQKLTLVGYLGNQPKMKFMDSGTAVTKFNVATNRQYTDNNGEKVKQTTWFTVSVFGKQAEACNQYLHSGSKVLVEGRLNADKATGYPRIWTKKDGTSAASYEITAQSVKFLDSKGDNQQAQQAQAAPQQAQQSDFAPPPQPSQYDGDF